MATQLTKGILEGKKSTVTVDGLEDLEGNEYEVEIAPVTYTQTMKLQELVTSGIDISGATNIENGDLTGASFDTSTILKNSMEANLKAAAWGTVDEYWTQKTIDKEWLNDWVVKVGQKVMEISGVDVNEEETTEQATE